MTEIVGLQSTALKNVLVSGWFFLRKVPTSKSSVFAEAMNEASKLKGELALVSKNENIGVILEQTRADRSAML